MHVLSQLIDVLHNLTMGQAWFWFTVENVALFLITLGAGQILINVYKERLVVEPPEPITRTEIALAASTVFINSAITVLGWVLWRGGIIQLRLDFGWTAWIDIPVLFFSMDFAMYILHRIAHHPWLYPWVHTTHHRFENPRPLTLFVLNPMETLSFGLLWLALLSIYTASWLGITVYLGLNLAFGLLGHLGVEPTPQRWLNIPLLRYISTSTFHAEHHQDKGHNFGFYTLIWDHLFGTLSPDYRDDFNMATSGQLSVHWK